MTERDQRIRKLVDEYRAACLWFLRADYYPESDDEVDSVLDSICRHGDVAAFQKADALREWLSRPSNARSAG